MDEKSKVGIANKVSSKFGCSNKDWEHFFVSSEERSFRIIVEGQFLFVSKEMLAAASPIFKQMIYADCKTAPEQCIEWKGKSLPDVLGFLNCIFSSKKTIDFCNIDTLLDFAHEYKVKGLEFDCGEFLKKQMAHVRIGQECVFDILLPAARHTLLDIVDRCVPYVAALPSETFDSFRRRLPLFVIAAVLESKLKRLEAEQHVWNWTSDRKFTKACTCCSRKSKRYCKHCSMCNWHRGTSVKCQGYHDVDCRAAQEHNKKCRQLEVDETNPLVTSCLCGAVSCLCAFVDYDKDVLKTAFE